MPVYFGASRVSLAGATRAYLGAQRVWEKASLLVAAPAFVEITETSFTVSFSTTSEVRRSTDYRVFGAATWTTQAYVSALQRDHFAAVSGLTAGTAYEVRYRLVTADGVETTIGPYQVTTATPAGSQPPDPQQPTPSGAYDPAAYNSAAYNV